MNPLVLIAGKMLLERVDDAVSEKIHKRESVKTVKTGNTVYYAKPDKKKAAVWAFVVAAIGLAGAMGYIPPEVAEVLREIATNPEIREGAEAALESASE